MKVTKQIIYWNLGGFDGCKSVEEALDEAKAMGFDGLELTFDTKAFGPGVKEERCKEIRKYARSIGMKIESMASGFYWGCSLASKSAAKRRKAIAYTKEYLQAAKWVGAKTVLVVPGAVAVPWDPSQPVIPYAEVWKNATASIRALLPTAKKLGVTIALENVWNWFLADPIAMKTFIDQFKSARVKCYFDVGNCCINGYPEHWIEILGKRIGAIHFKNFNREDCGGNLHGFGDDLLKGAVDFNAVKKALNKIKYNGTITAEMIPFCRLPDLVLPDMKLARATGKAMAKILG